MVMPSGEMSEMSKSSTFGCVMCRATLTLLIGVVSPETGIATSLNSAGLSRILLGSVPSSGAYCRGWQMVSDQQMSWPTSAATLSSTRSLQLPLTAGPAFPLKANKGFVLATGPANGAQIPTDVPTGPAAT